MVGFSPDQPSLNQFSNDDFSDGEFSKRHVFGAQDWHTTCEQYLGVVRAHIYGFHWVVFWPAQKSLERT
jgi:hypothetical protein